MCPVFHRRAQQTFLATPSLPPLWWIESFTVFARCRSMNEIPRKMRVRCVPTSARFVPNAPSVTFPCVPKNGLILRKKCAQLYLIAPKGKKAHLKKGQAIMQSISMHYIAILTRQPHNTRMVYAVSCRYNNRQDRDRCKYISHSVCISFLTLTKPIS